MTGHGELEGLPPGTAVRIHHHLARMPWSARIRVLLGLPVCIEISTGPLIDVTELEARSFGPDDLTGPGGPWEHLA